MAYHHELAVRYIECDMQGVVFNGHYLAYVDDAMGAWMLAAVGKPFDELGFDIMVVHAELDWRGSARLGDTIGIECAVVRWGTTSFVVGFDAHVAGRPVCRVELTYVGIAPGTTDKTPPPDEFKRALDAVAA
jgi:acyl-CoA thioester hydrolase